jgi:hypothetical protein
MDLSCTIGYHGNSGFIYTLLALYRRELVSVSIVSESNEMSGNTVYFLLHVIEILEKAIHCFAWVWILTCLRSKTKKGRCLMCGEEDFVIRYL